MSAGESPRVDPFVLEALRRLQDAQQPPSDDPEIRRRRAAEEDRARTAALGISRPPLATEEHALPVSGWPATRLRVYWPSERRAEPVETGGLPILVYFFGGGFTIADIDWDGWDGIYRALARDAGIIVVAGEYALAPETRFPAQPEQCWAVFEWAAENARALGGDPERLAIGGASSGGNLAAAVTLINRDRARRPIRLQVLENPSLDLTRDRFDSAVMDADIPGVMDHREAMMLARQYLGDDLAAGRDPRASPLLAPSHEGLPPAVIYTAELDPLRTDGEEYARVLGDAGVPVTCVRYLSQTHASGGLRGAVPAADHRHRDLVAALRTLHDPATRVDPDAGDAPARTSRGDAA